MDKRGLEFKKKMDDNNEESSSNESSDEEMLLAIPDIRRANGLEDEFDILGVDVERAEPSGEDDSNDDVDREPFDVDLPSTHQYLQLPRVDSSFYEFKPIEVNTIKSVSIIKLPVVMFPNQLLPFHADDNVTVRQLLEASRTGNLIALKPDISGNVRNIATLIQVVQVSAINDEGRISIHALGRQRCKILEEHSAINGMRYGDVKILDDKELGPFISSDVPRGLARLRLPKRLAVYSHLTAHHSYIIEQAATKNFVQQILRWLSSWFPNDKIEANLSQGLTPFSFWVAANIPVDTVIRLSLLEESCTDRRLINECFHLQTVDRIVCRRCSTVLCQLSDIISISNEGNSGIFVNPNGYVHDMFTVLRLNSTLPQGNPSAEYSWFPGYEWTIQNCARCRSFIGWRFTSRTLKPRYFYGISRTMVCPRGRNMAVSEDSQQPVEEYLFFRL